MFLFFQSHLRAGNRGNEEINKIALWNYTSAFRQEMVTVLCLPGISDIKCVLHRDCGFKSGG